MPEVSKITKRGVTYNIKDEYARQHGAFPIKVVASGTTSLIAVVDTYYEIAGTVTSISITLPTPTDTSKVAMVVVHLTTGANSQVEIGAADDPQPDYTAAYNISGNKEYEISCLYNGNKWIITNMEVV